MFVRTWWMITASCGIAWSQPDLRRNSTVQVLPSGRAGAVAPGGMDATRDPWFPICAWFSGSSVIVALKSGPAGDHSLLGSRTPSAWTLRALSPTVAGPDDPRKEIWELEGRRRETHQVPAVPVYEVRVGREGMRSP